MIKFVLAGVGTALVAGLCFLWNRSIELEAQLTHAAETVRLIGLDNLATEQVLSKHIEVKKEIENARIKREEQLHNAMCFTGDDRIDALLRVLEENYDDHCGKASGNPAGTVR